MQNFYFNVNLFLWTPRIVVHWSIEYVFSERTRPPLIVWANIKASPLRSIRYIVLQRVTHWWWWRNCNMQHPYSSASSSPPSPQTYITSKTTNSHYYYLFEVYTVGLNLNLKFYAACEYVMYVLRVSGWIGRVGVRSYVCSFAYMSFNMDAATLISLYTIWL